MLRRYGGGDDIRFSRVILAVGLPIENIPIDLRKRIVLAARQAAARFPASEAAVVRLSPEFDAGDESGSALTWEFKFTMLSHVRILP